MNLEGTILCPFCNKNINKENEINHTNNCKKYNEQIKEGCSNIDLVKSLNDSDYFCYICKVNMSILEKEDHIFAHNLEIMEYNEEINTKLNKNNIKECTFDNFEGKDNIQNSIIIDENYLKRIDIKSSKKRSQNMSIKDSILDNNGNICKAKINMAFSDFINIFQSISNDNKNLRNSVVDDLMFGLPITKIEDVNKLKKENKECSICFSEFINNEEILFLPCVHIFHKYCIIEWFKAHDICPICKYKLSNSN